MPARLEQEPYAPLGLVDPVLKQARGRNIAMLVTQPVRLAHARRELPIVVAQLGQHILRRYVVCVVVEDPLEAANLTDRTQRRSANFPDALGDVVRDAKELVGMFVQQQMVITEVWT